ncbi:GlxA family transcriptional regulator [Mucilaginibacter sp. SG564]|uniref:GlxA family transcriptional regulator n=1 Tax=Mucilaginibacter sp. SG564 TaxID=2587022 RepID=UPI001C129A0D|nr:helix-turn-helix domain-containing protein [Mucilaginibacter sp. SG564]NOW96018.1 transcriptional regulator GlxA family with amidase domain [Mucilaginibacter sp. SG564]
MKMSVKNKGSLPGKKKVVIVAMARPFLLDIAGPSDVFNFSNKCLQDLGRDDGYDIILASPTSDVNVVSSGIHIRCCTSVMEVEFPIDTLLIAGNDLSEHEQPKLEPFHEWLSGVNEQNTRRVGSVCSGAFALAKVGLLDGRKATTHWDYAQTLKRKYPKVLVDINQFYIKDGYVYTSGGVSSGIDLALALVEEDFGRDIAVKVAREMVFYLNRPGFQSQFGNLVPVFEKNNIATRLHQLVKENLSELLDLNILADKLHMSGRTLSRLVIKETGMSPVKFVEKLRVDFARKLLEESDFSLERISVQCGLGGLVSMRRVFIRHLSITPSDYRKLFKNATLKEAEKSNLVET